jgi:phosphoribosylanthranilate isomerase
VGSIFAGGPRAIDAAAARRNADAAPRGGARRGRFPPQAVAGRRAAVAGRRRAAGARGHARRRAAARRPRRARGRHLPAVLAGAVWAALRVEGDALPAHAADLFAAADAVVVDAKVAGGALGGTGVALPWAAARRRARGRARQHDVVLAGGLRSANVAEAIASLAPDVVDVSSGVEESPGVKRHARC